MATKKKIRAGLYEITTAQGDTRKIKQNLDPDSADYGLWIIEPDIFSHYQHEPQQTLAACIELLERSVRKVTRRGRG